MFFHSKIFLYSLFFWGLSEYVTTDDASSALGVFFENHFWLGFLLVLIVGAIFFQIASGISRRASMTPIPVIFVLSSFGLLYFVESIRQQNALIMLSSVAYYFMHISLYRLHVYQKDKTAKGIIAAAAVATIFLFYCASYGFYLNFAIPLWILMMILMVATTFISFQYLWLINEEDKNVLNYSLVLGFIMAEIIWVVNFWPFGYLTTGAVTLIFYYVLWDLTQCHLLNSLSKRRVVGNLVFFGILVAMVLTSSRWLPLV